MYAWLRKWWGVLKLLLALVILLAIGRQFWRDLQRPELWRQPLHMNWLILSGLLYIVGLGFLASYWYRLLRSAGQKPTFLGAVRAHYVGQMGKYLPGKAWALILRSSLVSSSEVSVGVAVQTSFYEVLAGMAVGASLAVVLFWLLGPRTSTPLDLRSLWSLLTLRDQPGVYPGHGTLALLALIVLLPVGIPALPAVFNRIAQRLASRFQQDEATSLPTIGYSALLQAYLFASLAWFMMGASLWAMTHAVVRPSAFEIRTSAEGRSSNVAGRDSRQLTTDNLRTWGLFTAFASFSYVAGFLIIIVPSGLGVREYFLTLFLVPELYLLVQGGMEEARGKAVLVVVLLRLVWTAAEVAAMGILYWLPTRKQLRT
jgi:glycosyltransferase 2 family protein